MRSGLSVKASKVTTLKDGSAKYIGRQRLNTEARDMTNESYDLFKLIIVIVLYIQLPKRKRVR